MWESPINVMEIQDSFVSEIKEKTEEMVFTEIKRIGIDVNKEELIKALQYDRGQYEKGYSDGYAKAIEEFAERLKTKCDFMIKSKWNSGVAPISWANAYADFKDDIEEIAEQMKGGAE